MGHMKSTNNIQHTNTEGLVLTFTVTLGGETREVKFHKSTPDSFTTSHDNSMAAQVGRGAKVHRAEVHARQDSVTGEWFLVAYALGKCKNVRLVGWADEFEGSNVGNVQNNKYRV